MITNRKVRIFYTIIVIWAVVSLIFSAQIGDALFQYDALVQTAGVLIVICSAPALPVLWIWISERSPWTFWLVAPVLLLGASATVAFVEESNLEDLWFMPSGWLVVACFVAWLLKGVTRIDALSWRKTASVPISGTVSIDHGKYLRLLDDQTTSGFPNVMRVKAHFVSELPNTMKSFKDHGPVPDQEALTASLSQARQFMLEKVSCELAFLCAVSFFERMCGPDFRYTEQYKFLVNRMLSIEVFTRGQDQVLDIKTTAVVLADLEGVVSLLDRHRADRHAKSGQSSHDDNVTISIVALRLLIKERLIEEISEHDSVKFTRMIGGGMNKMRETFSRQSTQV